MNRSVALSRATYSYTVRLGIRRTHRRRCRHQIREAITRGPPSPAAQSICLCYRSSKIRDGVECSNPVTTHNTWFGCVREQGSWCLRITHTITYASQPASQPAAVTLPREEKPVTRLSCLSLCLCVFSANTASSRRHARDCGSNLSYGVGDSGSVCR
jgi:hypothetical protein